MLTSQRQAEINQVEGMGGSGGLGTQSRPENRLECVKSFKRDEKIQPVWCIKRNQNKT